MKWTENVQESNKEKWSQKMEKWREKQSVEVNNM